MSADYSQIELRIMAHLSGDAVAAAGRSRRAPTSTAPPPPRSSACRSIEVTPDQRRYIKAVNFGLIYGMSAFGLAAQLDIERAAAQQFIDRYFARYPGVALHAYERTRELARAAGLRRNRVRPPAVAAGHQRRRRSARQGAERAAINAPMQGTAADLIKLAMIAVQGWLDRERRASKLILQVHDELVLEAPVAEVEE